MEGMQNSSMKELERRESDLKRQEWNDEGADDEGGLLPYRIESDWLMRMAGYSTDGPR